MVNTMRTVAYLGGIPPEKKLHKRTSMLQWILGRFDFS